MQFPYLTGTVLLKSDLLLEDLGKILSEQVFSNLPFGGKELNIYDEIPAIFIQKGVLGLSIILCGYPGFGSETGYELSVIPKFAINNVQKNAVHLDTYLELLLSNALKDDSRILVERANSS